MLSAYLMSIVIFIYFNVIAIFKKPDDIINSGEYNYQYYGFSCSTLNWMPLKIHTRKNAAERSKLLKV